MKKTLFLTLIIFLISACASASTPDLSGEWRLESYGETANPIPAIPGVDTSFTFENGQFGGNAGCNSFGGTYKLQGSAITFSKMISTMMFCEQTDKQEQGVLAIFGSGMKLTMQNENRLTLTSEDGAQVIHLVRK